MTVGKLTITTEDMLFNEAIAHLKLKQNTVLSSEFICLINSSNCNKIFFSGIKNSRYFIIVEFIAVTIEEALLPKLMSGQLRVDEFKGIEL
jgi:hypothetical protein